MKISIVYDNNALEGFTAGWGFSCLVEAHGQRVLFDTGCNGNELELNMKKLGINFSEINGVFISHAHQDHIKGLLHILGLTRKIPVYILDSFSEDLKERISKLAKTIEVKNAQEIEDGFYTTGELGTEIKEQSLVIKSEKGNIIVCGCSHPGMDVILKKSQEFGTIKGILGGFHDFDKINTLKDLEIIIPCHCTKKMQEILSVYLKKSIMGKAGMVFDL
ncbi:MBL fold metallo-hydrolase [Candidatus Micrarchaeota archaeon]|nr:MBL fold metallo-hydrolase [Candidatus Micrarchaeota archaeon]